MDRWKNSHKFRWADRWIVTVTDEKPVAQIEGQTNGKRDRHMEMQRDSWIDALIDTLMGGLTVSYLDFKWKGRQTDRWKWKDRQTDGNGKTDTQKDYWKDKQ
jgi:hypothetical protein